MIETIVLDYLSGELNVPVWMEVPPDPPETYVVIEKLGSRRENHIDRASMAVQSCSLISLYHAAALNDSVKRAMDDIVTRGDVSRCGLNSDYNFTDKKTKTYRYQAVFDLTYFDD